MIHEMKLTKKPFERMKRGIKTLELRLFDDKRKAIKLGDKILFKKLPELEDEVVVEVTGLLVYAKFEQMIQDLPASLLGYKEEDKDYLRSSMYEVYTPEEEEKFGAMGIRIRLISNTSE